MSQLKITDAGIAYKDLVFAGTEVQNITKFIFANVPGLLPTDPISATAVVPVANVVHTEPVDRVSRLEDNAIVMSAVLGYDVGDFDFNWYGAIATKADGSEILIAVVHTALQTKTKTVGAITGNYSVKSILWRSNAIAATLSVTLATLPWQVSGAEFVSRGDFDAHSHTANDVGADTSAQVQAKIDAAITAIMSAPPATLDTLNELAAALGDDPNFATTMTNLIGTKLNANAKAADAALFDGKSYATVLANARSGLSSDSHTHTPEEIGAIKVYQNPLTQTFTRKAVVTELNCWHGVPQSFTFTGAGYQSKDKLVINRLSQLAGQITVTIIGASIFDPGGTNIGNTITLTDVPFTVILHKISVNDWFMQVIPTGAV